MLAVMSMASNAISSSSSSPMGCSSSGSGVNLHKTNTSSGILKAKLLKNGKVSNGNASGAVSAKVNDYRKVS